MEIHHGLFEKEMGIFEVVSILKYTHIKINLRDQ
jgi:hypothetical protein